MGMMMGAGAGLGGLNPKPLNAPDAPAPLPGVQPGSTGIIVASRVIIAGPVGQFLIYSPTTGAGNLIESHTGAAGTDPFGNAYLKGATTYEQRLIPAAHYVAANIQGTTITYYTAGTEAGPWTALADISYKQSSNSALSGLYIDGSNGTSLFFPEPPATPAVQVVGGSLVATDPVLGTVEEGYHQLGTLAGYTVNNAVFWLDAQGNTNFDINVTSLGANALTTVFSVTLPAVYRPTGLSKTYAMASNAGVFSNPRLGITTAGAVSIVFTANTAAGVVGGAVMPRN